MGEVSRVGKLHQGSATGEADRCFSGLFPNHEFLTRAEIDVGGYAPLPFNSWDCFCHRACSGDAHGGDI